MSACQLIELAGTLDTVAAEAMRQTLLAARGAPVTLEGSSTQRVGGAALQVLLSARRQWAEDGHGWKIEAPSDALRDALCLMGASYLLEEGMDA